MPDFNHKRLRPVAMVDGNTNAQYLGYVQNVVAGQALAELIYLDTIPEGFTPQDEPPVEDVPEEVTLAEALEVNVPLPVENGFPSPAADAVQGEMEAEELGYREFYAHMFRMDPRFVYNNPVFPMGPNCARDPENPNRIIAQANGYCFYHQGLITVKKLLNVRQDVNFHTGNITFVGDIAVHGDVYPGFSLTGSNILVKGRVDGGSIKAKGNVAIEGGIKAAPTALVRAGGTVRLSYCERAKIITPGNLIIDGNCMHSELYVGGSLIVRGRLQGGSVHANGLVYAKNQIGDEKGAPTKLSLGYNPTEFLHLKELDTMQEEQNQRIHYYTSRSRKGPHFAAECAPFLELAQRKLAVIKEFQHAAWRRFTTDIRKAARNKVVAPGYVYPGVEISIGRAYHKVVDEQRDIFYCLHEDEIVYGFPALAKDYAFPSREEGKDSGPEENETGTS